MSLDVYLERPGVAIERSAEGIFIRENGQTVQISREEWDRRFPDREPVTVRADETYTDNRVYSSNITHNLGKMAREAGVYDCCWRADEHGITHAKQLIEPLQRGISAMEAEPERFWKHNPENGWGSYASFLPWLKEYLAACIEYPDAEVRVWR